METAFLSAFTNKDFSNSNFVIIFLRKTICMESFTNKSNQIKSNQFYWLKSKQIGLLPQQYKDTTNI